MSLLLLINISENNKKTFIILFYELCSKNKSSFNIKLLRNYRENYVTLPLRKYSSIKKNEKYKHSSANKIIKIYELLHHYVITVVFMTSDLTQ